MTATQLRKLLERANLTVRGAAQGLEIHERTMHRYLSGDAPVPRVVELAVRWLADNQ